MADGRVVIDVLVNDKQLGKLDGRLGGVEKSASKVTSTAKGMTLAMLATKAVVGVFNAITASLDQAISRFDTMRQYPRVMELVGFSTEQSERSVRRLADGIEGLPTRLDEVVDTAQGLALVTDDINYATDLTLGLNNAFLASGASAGDASRGLVQYQQMLATGKADMQSWRTLQETMPVALRMTAEAFGYAGSSATNDFYEALRDGDITFEQFGDKIIELNNQTGGFADMAKESSKGIATSWQNVKTAVVNGTTFVIEALDNMLKHVTGKNIAETFDVLKQVVLTTFRAIARAIEKATPYIKIFYDAISGLLNYLIEHEWILTTLITTYASFKIMTTVADWANKLKDVMGGLSVAMQSSGGSLSGFLTNLGAASTGFSNFLTLVTSAPAIIAGVIGATVGLAMHFHNQQKKRIEEMAAVHNEKAQEMADAQKEFSNAVQQSIDDHETQRGRAIRAADGLKSLAEETFALAEQQGRTGAETKQLEENIKELNDAIGQEVIFYNEKTGAISTTAGELSSYLDLMKAENQLALEKERQVEVDEQLVEATKNRKLAQEAYHEQQREIYKLEQEKQELESHGNMASQTAAAERRGQINEEIQSRLEALGISREAYEEARNSENDLIEQKEDIAGRVETLYGEMADAQQSYTDAVKENSEIIITSLEQLTEADRAYVEALQGHYKQIEQASTDMFNKISTETELTAGDMLETLRHNQQAVADWATNLETLTNMGVNEGMLTILRDMGPAGAGHVQALTQMSTDELAEFNAIFEKSGDTAGDNLMKAFDIKEDRLPQGINELITATDTGLTEGFNSIEWSKYSETMGLGIVEGIEDQIPNVKKASEKTADEAINSLKTGFDSHSPSRKAMEEGTNFIDGLNKGITDGKNKVVKTVNSLADDITKAINNSLKDINLTTSSEFDSMHSIVREKTSTIQTAVITTMQQIKSRTQSELLAISSNVTRRTSDIATTSQNALNRIRTMFTVGIESIKTTVNSGFDYIYRAIHNKLYYIINDTQNFSTQIGSAFSAGVGSAMNAGYSMGDGFRQGLNSTRGMIIATARDIANSASSTIRNSLKIKSPSRVGEELGSFTGEGFAIGLQSWIDKISGIAEMFGTSIFSGYRPAFSMPTGQTVSNTTTDNSLTLNVEQIIWNGESDIRQTMEDIGFISGQEQWRLENA